jgi:hypothetical protein
MLINMPINVLINGPSSRLPGWVAAAVALPLAPVQISFEFPQNIVSAVYRS